MAIAVLLTFHCLLRPNETSNLTMADVAEGTIFTFVKQSFGVVTIRQPKTRLARVHVYFAAFSAQRDS